MKKLLLSLALTAAVATGMQAQTILSEDFEITPTQDTADPLTRGSGWTVVKSYKGENFKFNWFNEYRDPSNEKNILISGAHCATVGAPFSATSDGVGPREEILLSPELNLDDDYLLKFSFIVSPMNCQANSQYDLQVRVVEGDEDPSKATTVFTIQDERVLREADITPFPIEDWNVRTAKVDLSEFKGKKVKLAFVFKMMQKTGNLVHLDDITVTKHTPATGPVGTLSKETYSYGNLYIGEKKWSDVLTIKNTGLDGLKITSVEMPENMQLSMDPKKVNLLRNQAVEFNIAYKASIASPASGKVVFHTNGGDLTYNFTASKQALPEGASFEGFEEYYPPAGWKSTNWGRIDASIEGDYSVSCDGGYGKSYLQSPRLDLTDGGEVSFSFLNAYNGESAPEYEIELQVSYDGGTNWTKKWDTTGQPLNEITTVTVPLGTTGSDESYIRWYYPEVESDDYGAFEHSHFLLDRVLLPNVFGADGVPGRARVVAPENNATDIFPKEVTLRWEPAQFADGYKLYVGTNTEANDLIDGLDLGKAVSYTIPVVLNNETVYRWKVAAYNAKGNATDVPVYKFTTQKNASVNTYPFTENFDKVNTKTGVPNGWVTTSTSSYSNRGWSPNKIYPYKNDGKEYPAMSSFWLNPGETSELISPEVVLPSDKVMAVTFLWGNRHPSDLNVDPAGLIKKNNADPDNGKDKLSFQVNDGSGWKTLTYISEPRPKDGKSYWVTEKVDLAAYQGKTVQFRWFYEALGNNDGNAIACLKIDENKDYTAGVNRSSWNAGQVNCDKAATSGDIFTLFNQGTKELTVEKVEFATNNFTTTLAEGDKIPADGAKKFGIRFDALKSDKAVKDKLTVTLTGDAKIEIDVEGVALPENVRYYSFEPNELDYDWKDDFTMIDVDNSPNFIFTTSWVNYSAGGQKCAFSAENDSYETGMYGMMSPVSGLWALVGACPMSTTANNWIIYQKVTPKAGATFEFYGRNSDCNGTVMPDPLHYVTVLVSEDGNTDTKEFKPVMARTEMPLCDGNEYNHYVVPLDAYVDKPVHIALQHTTDAITRLAYFDDFKFTNIDTTNSSAVEDLTIEGDTEVEVYSIDGVRVATGKASEALSGLGKGIYVVKGAGKAIRVML